MTQRVLREQDQKILDAMPSQLTGPQYGAPRRVEATHGRARKAEQMVLRAKAFAMPQYGTDADGNTVQVIRTYPDGDSLYRLDGSLIVGQVTSTLGESQ